MWQELLGAKQPRWSCLAWRTRGQGTLELRQLLYSECLSVLVLHEMLRTVCHKAALVGNLNLPMRYDELSALSPVVRREVLTRELSRCIKDVPRISVVDTNMDNVVEVLLGLSLHQVVDGIQDPTKLTEQVQNAKDVISATTRETQCSAGSPSPATSHDSRLLDPNALNVTALAPEHPLTPLSLSVSLSTPPSTSSLSGSIMPSTSEKDRLMVAVVRLEPKN